MTHPYRPRTMRPFEDRLADLTSVLTRLVKHHDGDYVAIGRLPEWCAADEEEAWKHARRLLGHAAAV